MENVESRLLGSGSVFYSGDSHRLSLMKTLLPPLSFDLVNFKEKKKGILVLYLIVSTW